MAKFDDYMNRYKHIRMERRDGVLQIIFHTEGGPLKWSMAAHEELGYAFAEISRDEETKSLSSLAPATSTAPSSTWAGTSLR
jgi:hypothetical protein